MSRQAPQHDIDENDLEVTHPEDHARRSDGGSR